MPKNNFENNMLQLIGESDEMSIKQSFDKNARIACCFLLWAKKQNGEDNDSLIEEAVQNLKMKDDFSLEKFEVPYEYTVEDCVEEIKYIIDQNINDRGDWEHTSKSSLDNLVVSLLNLKANESFCDFGSGDGKLLSFVATDANNRKLNCSFTGYEISNQQVFASKCFLKVLGIDAEIVNCDYAREEIDEQFDKAYVFPPFGLRYSIDEWESLKSQYANLFTSRGETELLYLLKAFEKVKDNGKLVAIFPKGVAFRKSGTAVRKYLLENNYLEGIISLPPRTLVGLTIPADIWILSKARNKETGVKMVDSTNMILDFKSKINVELNVPKIMGAYEHDAKHVSLKEIKAHEYMLLISAYEIEEPTKIISNPVPLSEVCEVKKGSQYTISKFKNQLSSSITDYQLLTSINIQDGIVDYDSLAYINPDPKLLKFKLNAGDIVITTKSTVVKTFVANDLPDRNIIVTGGMIILRPNTDKMNPTYIKMFLDSSIGKSELNSIVTGATIGFIPFNEFKKRMIISCPSLEKQNALAEQYNKMLWTVNALTKQLEDTKAKLENVIEDSFEEEN